MNLLLYIITLHFSSARMVESEEFLQEIHSQLSASDKHMDKEALRNYLLDPGEKRLQLISWALSEMNIVIKNRGNVFFFFS